MVTFTFDLCYLCAYCLLCERGHLVSLQPVTAPVDVCVCVFPGPSGTPAAAVWPSCHRRGQRLCGGDLLQDLPAVCGVQPPPEAHTPEPAAGPVHRYACTHTPEPAAVPVQRHNRHTGLPLTHLSPFLPVHAEACASPPQSRLVYCYPVRLALATPPLPRVELHFENDMACVRFRGEMVKVNRGHFSKLVSGDITALRYGL